MDLDFTTAFKKPFTDIKKLLIGIALSILPIVSWIAAGYQMAVGKAEMKRDKNLPEWTDWGGLLFMGFMAFVIGVIYSLPMIVVIIAAAGGIIMTALRAFAAGGQAAAISILMDAMAGMMGAIALIAAMFLLIAYIVPSAIMHYVAEERFGAAFKFGSILKKAFSGKYAVAWIVSMAYSLLLGGLLIKIPYVGPAVAGFITGITQFSMLGEVFRAK